MLAGSNERGTPRNNLKEQLALHKAKKPLTPSSKTTYGDKRPFSFKRLTPQGQSRIRFSNSPSNSFAMAASGSTLPMASPPGSGNKDLPLTSSLTKKRVLPDFLKSKHQQVKSTGAYACSSNSLSPRLRGGGLDIPSLSGLSPGCGSGPIPVVEGPVKPVMEGLVRPAMEGPARLAMEGPARLAVEGPARASHAVAPVRPAVPVAFVTPLSRSAGSRRVDHGGRSSEVASPCLETDSPTATQPPLASSSCTSSLPSSPPTSCSSGSHSSSNKTVPSASSSPLRVDLKRRPLHRHLLESLSPFGSDVPGSLDLSPASTCASTQAPPPGSCPARSMQPPSSLHQPALPTPTASGATSSLYIGDCDVVEEMEGVARRRMAVMDDICGILSECSSSEITAVFKDHAMEVQRKLAIRKNLLNKEKELKSRLGGGVPSSASVGTGCQSWTSCHSSSVVATTRNGRGSECSKRQVDEQELNDLLAAEAEEFCWDSDDLLQSVDEADMDSTHRPAPPSSSSSSPKRTVIPTTAVIAASSSTAGASPTYPPVPFGKKSTFKPPFLQAGAVHSMKSRSGQTSAKPDGVQAKKGPRDDSAEFRSDYGHAKVMYNIFNQVFGLKKFRPNQLEAVNAIVLGKDAFILMPTGGGKSLCYQLPALMVAGVTVVVSPLRSLIQDQVQKLISLGIPARHLSSDLTVREENEVYTSLSRKDPMLKLLYVTPEKLSASNRLLSSLQNLHARQKLARFVIDEAHCISQWGHDFRPDYKKLSELRHKFPGIPTVALTATATPRVRTDILYQLTMHKTCKWFTQSFNRVNLKYSVVAKKPKRVNEDIVELISSNFPGQSGIVYCLSKKDCEFVAEDLRKGNIAALCYHAGMSDADRSTVQQRWLQEDGCKVVCATIAFGMGIDKPDVRFVIHHSLPKSMEGYYQEAGRAGRDANPAHCILYYSYSDMARLRRMIKREDLRYEQEKVHVDNLLRMVQYCENETDCRRVQLLEYFAESFDPSFCKNGSTPCDNCQSQVPFVSEDVTDLVKVIVQSVQMTRGNQFTLNQYMDALKGSSSSNKIARGALTKLPLFGAGCAKTKHDLERLLHMLVMKEVLSESMQIGAHDNVVCYVQLGSKAKDVLSGKISDIILKVKRQKARNTTSKYGPTVSDTKEDQLKAECYKALCRLRLDIANKHKLKNPEYILASASLQAMSRLLPTTKEELLAVEGYTEVRWNRFDGEEFLKITREFSQEVAKLAKTEEGGSVTDGTTTDDYYRQETTSVYFQGNEGGGLRPVMGKGKRKKVGDLAPKPKRPAIPILNFDSSEDEFESIAPRRGNIASRRAPQLMPHPNH